MKITLLAVCHRPPQWVELAWDTYSKRLGAHWQLDLKLIKPAARDAGKTAPQNMAFEAQRIEAALKTTTGTRIALDERGQSLTSEQFLTLLQDRQKHDGATVFIIGGPDGLDASLKSSCPIKIQLSAMTLPHALVQVLFIEQVYRASTLAAGHPYHRS
jgi:23S rRNA (pseudouridine1915-N3)-methyltransferase